MPHEKVFDENKMKNLSVLVCEHASQGYPLRDTTIASVIEEAKVKFGWKRDDEKEYSLHPGDGGRFYLSDGTESKWLPNSSQEWTLHVSEGPEGKAYVNNSVESLWCESFFVTTPVVPRLSRSTSPSIHEKGNKLYNPNQQK